MPARIRQLWASTCVRPATVMRGPRRSCRKTSTWLRKPLRRPLPGLPGRPRKDHLTGPHTRSRR